LLRLCCEWIKLEDLGVVSFTKVIEHPDASHRRVSAGWFYGLSLGIDAGHSGTATMSGSFLINSVKKSMIAYLIGDESSRRRVI
jgi:hypothetical protein